MELIITAKELDGKPNKVRIDVLFSAMGPNQIARFNRLTRYAYTVETPEKKQS